MKVIGICGPSGAGKDLAAGVFSERGAALIDVDALGHGALVEHQAEIVSLFGNGILREDGSIDRGRLGQLVFSDRNALRQLEELLHPAMVAEVRRLIDTSNATTVVINAAILFRMGLHELCDSIICVRSCFLLRLIRLFHRDRGSIFSIIKRMLSQKNLCPQSSFLHADIQSVYNGLSRTRFIKRVEALAKGLGVERK